MNKLENRFHEEMRDIYFTAKRELKYNASRFIQLVSSEGGLNAAKQLISKSGGTYGFEVLWENGRLDLSVEALVLKPEYEELFTQEEQDICLSRLKEYGYTSDV
jgi:hypothetical protein